MCPLGFNSDILSISPKQTEYFIQKRKFEDFGFGLLITFLFYVY